MTSEPTAYLALRPPHRTFLFWAVLVMILTSVGLGVVGVQQDGVTAGTGVRVVFVLAMLVFWVIALRRGTVVDEQGMELRSGLGSRQVPWGRVERLGTDQPGQGARRVTALVEGRAVVLPGVVVGELPQLEHRHAAALQG